MITAAGETLAYVMCMGCPVPEEAAEAFCHKQKGNEALMHGNYCLLREIERRHPGTLKLSGKNPQCYNFHMYPAPNKEKRMVSVYAMSMEEALTKAKETVPQATALVFTDNVDRIGQYGVPGTKRYNFETISLRSDNQSIQNGKISVYALHMEDAQDLANALVPEMMTAHFIDNKEDDK